MNKPAKQGQNCIIGDDVVFGQNVHLGHNVIIEDHVRFGDNIVIEENTIVRGGVDLLEDSYIGANCILGEHLMDWHQGRPNYEHQLKIGAHALIRSHTTIYGDSVIGEHFQTGHYVSIRENSQLGNHVSVGNYSDIQGKVRMGNYVRLHSNDRIEQYSQIDDYVWLAPGVELCNDPTPPSDDMMGVHVHSFAVIGAKAVILPGREVKSDSLVAAGAVVTKDVESYTVVGGNPAKVIGDVRDIKNKKTGEPAYPWRYHFSRAMPWDGLGYEAWYNDGLNLE